MNLGEKQNLGQVDCKGLWAEPEEGDARDEAGEMGKSKALRYHHYLLHLHHDLHHHTIIITMIIIIINIITTIIIITIINKLCHRRSHLLNTY